MNGSCARTATGVLADGQGVLLIGRLHWERFQLGEVADVNLSVKKKRKLREYFLFAKSTLLLCCIGFSRHRFTVVPTICFCFLFAPADSLASFCFLF
jgi:hypothetical protein